MSYNLMRRDTSILLIKEQKSGRRGGSGIYCTSREMSLGKAWTAWRRWDVLPINMGEEAATPSSTPTTTLWVGDGHARQPHIGVATGGSDLVLDGPRSDVPLGTSHGLREAAHEHAYLCC
jgi:hypothetical protein